MPNGYAAIRIRPQVFTVVLVLAATAILTSCGAGVAENTPLAESRSATEPVTPTVVPALLTPTPTPTTPVEERTAPTPAANVPENEAPMGLADVQWPGDRQGIETLLRAMPEHLAGMQIETELLDPRSDRLRIGYGPPDELDSVQLTAADLTSGEFFPINWTARDIIAFELASGELLTAGRDEDLVWLRSETVASRAESTDSVTLHTLRWAPADSTWIFAAAAPDQESLERLLAEATKAAGAG